MVNKIYDPNYASACFFRSTVNPPQMKVMLQITEKCNLRCAHCFAEANCAGNEMTLKSIREVIIPQFIKNQVVKVTLTGGEPLVHPDVKEITETLLENEIGVSICTNGTLIDFSWVEFLSHFKNVHFNVSLDGMTMQSHGRFRGIKNESELALLKTNISMLGDYGLLNGILTTPNKYAKITEYVELCKFARNAGANYVLMNPLSPLGRGTKTQGLAYSNEAIKDMEETAHNLLSQIEGVVANEIIVPCIYEFLLSEHICPQAFITYLQKSSFKALLRHEIERENLFGGWQEINNVANLIDGIGSEKEKRFLWNSVICVIEKKLKSGFLNYQTDNNQLFLSKIPTQQRIQLEKDIKDWISTLHTEEIDYLVRPSVYRQDVALKSTAQMVLDRLGISNC